MDVSLISCDPAFQQTTGWAYRDTVNALATLLAAFLCAALSCTKHEARQWYADGRPFMPETIGAVSPVNAEAFPPEFREAAEAASAYFVKRGMRPDLHFAQIFSQKADDIELAVWPATAFNPKGRPHASGGGCITLHFNPRTHRIENGGRWQ
jgi:hypothetical protein